MRSFKAEVLPVCIVQSVSPKRKLQIQQKYLSYLLRMNNVASEEGMQVRRWPMEIEIMTTCTEEVFIQLLELHIVNMPLCNRRFELKSSSSESAWKYIAA